MWDTMYIDLRWIETLTWYNSVGDSYNIKFGRNIIRKWNIALLRRCSIMIPGDLIEEFFGNFQIFEMFSYYQEFINNNKTITPKNILYFLPGLKFKIHGYSLQLQEI